MSNVKRIHIEGQVPFDGHQENETWRGVLATCNAPAIGLRIAWGESEMHPNDHGGLTAVYRFTIHGIEAVSYSWLDAVKEAVDALPFGSISRFYVKDLEA